jgi:8-oxo-dGTP diphosphatase
MPPTFGAPRPDLPARDRDASYAVILGAEARVALVRGRRGLFLPGGGALAGESPEQTVAREILEETGREAIRLRLLGEAIQYFEAKGASYRMRATFFVAEVAEATGIEGGHEVIWMSPESVRGDLFHECHGWAIERAVR